MALSMDKFKDTFREEAFELLGHLEEKLMELEDHPKDGELINAAFRAIHTVKGSASMFGFDAVSSFAHEMETALDLCRNGSLSITKDFIGLALKGRDQLRQLMEFETEVPPDIADRSDTLLSLFRSFSKVGKPAAKVEAKVEAKSAVTALAPVDEAEPRTYRVTFKPARTIFRNGTRVLNLIEELSALGQADVFPHFEDIPALEQLDPESCYAWWEVVITTSSDENAIRDIFIFVEDQCELRVELLSEGEPGSTVRLGDILVDRGAVTPRALRDALDSQKKLGEVLVEQHILSKPQVDSALVEQAHLKKVNEQGETAMGSIRVASDKLDGLVDLVGELVTLQARLAQTSLGLHDSSLSNVSEQFERLIAQLRDNTMSIRMLPIGSTFNKFRRVVRDLSIDLGKEASLVTEGAETELDKTVIEKLGDPLVHIIRNSVDHGIEGPDERERKGKPRMGTIRLSARHSGAYVLIQVSDDGKGLDRDAIRAKAVERGLLSPAQEVGDQELYQLIFEPGFSTSKKVTKVSGRGVGMDVVKREIDSLGGSAQLSTVQGSGMTVTLKIPLTLAIIEGLLVRIGSEFFVVPLSSVDGCIEIRREELASLGRREIVSYREELVPFVRLRSFFGFATGAAGAESAGAESAGVESTPQVSGGADGGAARYSEEEPEIEQMVIASAQEYRVGLVVDQVIGDYQTVIKPLGRMYRDVDGISGATILGDGTVALILDVNRLAFVVQRESGLKAALGGA